MIHKFIRNTFNFCRKSTLIDKYNEELTQLKKQVKEGKVKESAYEQITSKFTKDMKNIDEDEKLQKIKQYLIKNLPEEKVHSKSEYIPNELIIKKLIYGDKKILMFGVEEENQEHCIYIDKLIQKMNVQVVLTALPPDLPYFIKTELSFNEEWKLFLTQSAYAKEKAKFYLSPTPKSLEDLCLQGDSIGLVKNSLRKSKQFYEILYGLTKYDEKWEMFLPNALLTPFTSFGVNKIYFCDDPALKERQMWANEIPLSKMKDLFQIYKINYKQKKLMNFDARILFPREILEKKFKYMINILKLASDPTNVSFFICPAEYCELFLQIWKKKQEPKHHIQYYQANKSQNMSFLEFLEKLVILDYICEPILNKYFVKYKNFPYLAQHTIGSNQHLGKIFLLWDHLHNTYKNQLDGSRKLGI